MRLPLPAFALLLLSASSPAWSAPATGSMAVHWDPGAETCGPANAIPPLQVHRYDAQTFVLRENLCATWEAPFMYLLVGGKQALLIDTGDVADPKIMPLKETVMGLLPGDAASKMPLIVVHSHGHLDHRSGDPQFEKVAGIQRVPADLDHVRSYFGFTSWPSGTAQIDLGERIIDVLPAPGHHPAHLLYYDRNTGILFSGDYLLPGRLLVDDIAAYRSTAQRVADFIRDRPVSFVLAGHIEKNTAGELLPWQSTRHPEEHALQLTKADVLALPAALLEFNGFYTRTGDIVVENPLHILAVIAAAALGALTALAVLLFRFFRHRRARRRD
jgi:glyoxylase-like metal-dependent hydrolase (beta-lactamase superfamily II)